MAPELELRPEPCEACRGSPPLALELFEAVTVVRARASHGDRAARVDLPLDPAGRAAPLAAMLRELFPPPAPTVGAHPAVEATPGWVQAPPPDPPPRALQLSILGLGGAALVTGVVLGIGGSARLSTLDDALAIEGGSGLVTGISYEEARDEHASASAQATLGLVVALIGAAVAGGAASWWWATD